MKSETQISNKKPTANSAGVKERKSSVHTGNTYDLAPNESDIRKVIESRAYLMAEENGFKGPPLDYWLAAEQEVRYLL